VKEQLYVILSSTSLKQRASDYELNSIMPVRTDPIISCWVQTRLSAGDKQESSPEPINYVGPVQA